MAEEILKGSGIAQNITLICQTCPTNLTVIKACIFFFSVSKDDFCSFCGNEDLPKTAVKDK